MSNANSLIVLDFETTGLSPTMGDRAIEIGAVLIENGKITDRFQQLMNPGLRISGLIESYTGISNAMLADAQPCAQVMNKFADFIGDHNLLAHNASFDQRFLDAELTRINRGYGGAMTCSLLAARRLFQNAPNHKLGTLVNYAGLAVEGNFHRALFDAEMTAKVWLAILESIKQRYALNNISFALMQKICKTPKKSVQALLNKEMNKEMNKGINKNLHQELHKELIK
jgi:DNA polymerase-3 subunit epsilon